MSRRLVPDRGRGTWTVAVRVAGGVLLLLSLTQPWTGQGAGSTVAAREYADLLLSGTVDALVPRWAGLAFYLVAGAGAVAVTASGVSGRAGWWIAGFALTLGSVTSGALVVALDLRPVPRPGLGAVYALVGLTALAVGLGLDRGHAGPSSRGDAKGRSGPVTGTRSGIGFGDR